jgi:hypothetical protein
MGRTAARPVAGCRLFTYPRVRALGYVYSRQNDHSVNGFPGQMPTRWTFSVLLSH